MYPVVPQFVFDEAGNFYSAKISESEKNNLKRTQFEIENILKFSAKVEKGVFLAENIGKNSVSSSFMFNDISMDLNFPSRFSVKIGSDNKVTPVESAIANRFWIRNIRLANDIPSANALLELRNERLEVIVTKDLNVNEELLMWFSDELMSLLGIPFLTPANIQGQKCYICHHCLRIFENPNPLKIHLATSCDRFDENILWQRIQSEILSRHQRKVLTQNHVIKNYEQTSQSSNSSQSPVMLKRFSAFQPVNPMKNGNMNMCLPITPSPPPLMPSLSPASTSSAANDSALAAAAHLETIVSNMGTSKQGHLCIYCGKLYSRKYGLKIHIRTHTGFKPLKCKFCLRPFGDPSNLNKHVRLHTQGNSVYKCTLCNKILVRRRDLQRHLQLKHGNDKEKLMMDQNGNGDQTLGMSENSLQDSSFQDSSFQDTSSESE